jgi:RNA polymerase primary sigma factor
LIQENKLQKTREMARYNVSTGAISGTAATTQYLKETKRNGNMTKAQERELIIEAQAGSLKARNAVVEANLRFAMQVARQYQGNGLDIEDLIGFANIGLFEAIERFDPEKNFKLSTFAVWYIRAELQKALNDLSRTVRIPSHRTGTEEYSTKSIHTPVGEDDNKETWADRHLEAESSKSVRDINDLRFDLQRALAQLPERQREALVRFHGIDREYAQCMEQIAEELNVTGERARQLVRQAETSIKKLPGIALLEQYLA